MVARAEQGEQFRRPSPRARLLARITESVYQSDDGVYRSDLLLTTGEVSTIFRVSDRTVRVWTDEGKIETIKTLGGHRRVRAGSILESLLSEESHLRS